MAFQRSPACFDSGKQPLFKARAEPNPACCRELIHWRGEPDPFKGDVPNARVREFAKEVVEVMFNTTPVQSNNSNTLAAQVGSPCSRVGPPPGPLQQLCSGMAGCVPVGLMHPQSSSGTFPLHQMRMHLSIGRPRFMLLLCPCTCPRGMCCFVRHTNTPQLADPQFPPLPPANLSHPCTPPLTVPACSFIPAPVWFEHICLCMYAPITTMSSFINGP